MSSLRKPLFLIAVALLGVVLLVELGTSVVVPFLGSSSAAVGWGIPCLLLLDGQLAFTALLMVVPLYFPERITGRLQGVASLIVSVVVLLGCLTSGVAASALLALLISLLLTWPFGPGVYAALGYGSFSTGAAGAALGLVVLAKLVSSGVLIVAHQRFLENKGLLLLIATSLLASILLSFLHGLVPGFLVSVSDLIGAIIVVVLAAIWAVVSLVFSIISITRAVA